jgi:hypothetical protein
MEGMRTWLPPVIGYLVLLLPSVARATPLQELIDRVGASRSALTDCERFQSLMEAELPQADAVAQDLGAIRRLLELVTRYPGSDPALRGILSLYVRALEEPELAAQAYMEAYFCPTGPLRAAYRAVLGSPAAQGLPPEEKRRAGLDFLHLAYRELARAKTLRNGATFATLARELAERDWIPRSSLARMRELEESADRTRQALRARSALAAPGLPPGEWSWPELTAAQRERVSKLFRQEVGDSYRLAREIRQALRIAGRELLAARPGGT